MITKKALAEKVDGIDVSHGLELHVDRYSSYYVVLLYGEKKKDRHGTLNRRNRLELTCIGCVPKEALEKVKRLQRWIHDITGVRPTAFGRFIDGVLS